MDRCGSVRVRDGDVAVRIVPLGVPIPLDRRPLSRRPPSLRRAAAASPGHAAGPLAERQSAQPLSDLGNAQRDPGKSLLQSAERSVRRERDSALRMRVYRGVLRVRVHLELQVLLHVRVFARRDGYPRGNA